ISSEQLGKRDNLRLLNLHDHDIDHVDDQAADHHHYVHHHDDDPHDHHVVHHHIHHLNDKTADHHHHHHIHHLDHHVVHHHIHHLDDTARGQDIAIGTDGSDSRGGDLQPVQPDLARVDGHGGLRAQGLQRLSKRRLLEAGDGAGDLRLGQW